MAAACGDGLAPRCAATIAATGALATRSVAAGAETSWAARGGGGRSAVVAVGAVTVLDGGLDGGLDGVLDGAA